MDMTQTLTTELVDATPEEWFEALSQSPELCAGLTVDVIQRMAARLAKLMREAQPVAEIRNMPVSSGEKRPAIYWFGKQDMDLPVGTKFYTAPPAPAVPDFGALTKLIVGRLIDCGAAGDDSIADAETFVYNACRAAMLAQPVSQGCKLVPVEPTSQVIAPFIKHCCENEAWVRQAWREMLAAAPEGGNG
jgi:hypothetical protein